MRKKRKKQIRSGTAVTWLVCSTFLLAWFVPMVWITWNTTLRYRNFYMEHSEIYNSAMSTFELGRAEQSNLPGSLETEIWSQLAYGSNRIFRVRTYDGDSYFDSDNSIDWQTAAAVYDGDGNMLACTGDYLFFAYDTEEYWENATADSVMNCSGYTRVLLDLNSLDHSGFDSDDDWSTIIAHDVKAMRFTGEFDGVEFHADRIEYISSLEFYDALYSRKPDIHKSDEDGNETIIYEYSCSEVIQTEQVPWRILYESGTDIEDAVTIYSTFFQVSDYEEGSTLHFENETYDNLLTLLSAQGLWGTRQQVSNGSITDLIVLEQGCIYDYDNPVENENGENTYTVKFYITTAVRCSPLLSAINELKGGYLVTFLVAAVLALILCRTLHRKLILPIRAVNDAMENQWRDIHCKEELFSGWKESENLVRNYSVMQDALWMRQNEITRLNTALDYAKTAEQNRRQMTSNIAHELKTPLAVIHSYAEGLKEHIAENKRDKYIDVILSEAERTDSMVLEMLDLSRLEAGKVKLSRDEFSLITLTCSIFEKLEMAAQAKNLQVDFIFPDDFTITADESRIAQVVENFAANAIQYTPVDGHISVKIQTGRSGTLFSIENDSEPLSGEALSKVWDMFYRVDESRSGGGTGLGLAIAKNIVELHGGKCSVRNTKAGVEFSFII